VSTDADQIAVAPGNLAHKWTNDERAFFHYKTDREISNLFSITSARYSTHSANLKLNADTEQVALEIYYSPGHEFNTHRMMDGMKSSLRYFSEQFSEYQFGHLRIVEVPVYHDRAQSIPGMITVAENMGFTFNAENEMNPDIPFFITAHEVAHQWWGDQVNAADVQGQLMIAETLAQYSALMVFKQRYGEEMTHEILKWNMRQYFKKRVENESNEPPLFLVESGQDFLYYRKGLIVMHALEQLISEEKINQALTSFIEDWNSKTGEKRISQERYPVSTDVLNYIYEVTPEPLVPEVKELFEYVTIYNNKIINVEAQELAGSQYQVEIEIQLEKVDVSEHENDVPFEFLSPVTIGFYRVNAQGKMELISNRDGIQKAGIHSLSYTFDKKPDFVVLDPKFTLLDKNVLDNKKRITWK
jgi:aminopeptidase N